jgi:hypothetical protein
MPAFQLDPTADGTYAEHLFTGAATRWQALSDADDASYIYITTGGDSRTSSAMANLPAEAVAVSEVYFNFRQRQATATVPSVRIGGFYNGSLAVQDPLSWTADGNPHSWSHAIATAPGGGGWTPATLNGCELYVRFDKPPTQPQCLEYWASGTYLLAGACFIPLLSLAAAVIGPGLQLAHMPGLARFIFERRRMPGGARVLIQRDEYQAALVSWRTYRFPRFAFL